MSWLLYDEFRGQVLASCNIIITPKYTGVSVYTGVCTTFTPFYRSDYFPPHHLLNLPSLC